MADTDPTNTESLRESYEEALTHPFEAINDEIEAGVADRNALGLQMQAEALSHGVDRLQSFKFSTDETKAAEFERWLRQQLQRGVLEVGGRGENRWIRTAYEVGVRHADEQLRAANVDTSDLPAPGGVTFNAPIHRSTVKLLYIRNFEALKNITEATATDVSETLAKGLTRGWKAERMAAELVERVEKIGITRATTLAHTEVVRAMNEGALNRYDAAGLDEVGAEVEYRTAQDDRVCPICKPLDGERYSIEEAHGILPKHPRCRCVWLPIVSDISTEEIRNESLQAHT